MYTVGRTAELTGVPRDTLRKWEQRYGVVAPARTEGNYRLYDDESVRRLSAMRGLVDLGWSPREAARRVLDGPATSDAEVQGAESDDDRLGVLARCAADFDVTRLQQALDEAFSEPDPAQVVDDWLLPSLARLGDAWQHGRVTVAGEHFVSAVVHGRLMRALGAFLPPPPGAPRVVVGLARGSRHELGALAFGLVLRSQGVAVTYVGGDLPVEAWVGTARTLRPAAAVVAVPLADDLPAVREVVQALAPSTPVHVGGAHQDRVEGASPLGHLAGAAARALAQTLTSGQGTEEAERQARAT